MKSNQNPHETSELIESNNDSIERDYKQMRKDNILNSSTSSVREVSQILDRKNKFIEDDPVMKKFDYDRALLLVEEEFKVDPREESKEEIIEETKTENILEPDVF